MILPSIGSIPEQMACIRSVRPPLCQHPPARLLRRHRSPGSWRRSTQRVPFTSLLSLRAAKEPAIKDARFDASSIHGHRSTSRPGSSALREGIEGIVDRLSGGQAVVCDSEGAFEFVQHRSQKIETAALGLCMRRRQGHGRSVGFWSLGAPCEHSSLTTTAAIRGKGTASSRAKNPRERAPSQPRPVRDPGCTRDR